MKLMDKLKEEYVKAQATQLEHAENSKLIAQSIGDEEKIKAAKQNNRAMGIWIILVGVIICAVVAILYVMGNGLLIMLGVAGLLFVGAGLYQIITGKSIAKK